MAWPICIKEYYRQNFMFYKENSFLINFCVSIQRMEIIFFILVSFVSFSELPWVRYLFWFGFKKNFVKNQINMLSFITQFQLFRESNQDKVDFFGNRWSRFDLFDLNDFFLWNIFVYIIDNFLRMFKNTLRLWTGIIILTSAENVGQVFEVNWSVLHRFCLASHG